MSFVWRSSVIRRSRSCRSRRTSVFTSALWISSCVRRVSRAEQPGVTRLESDDVRELRKRNRLLEQEVEVLRRATAYLSHAHLPGKGLPAPGGARRRRDPPHVDVSGAQFRVSDLLPVAACADHECGAGGGVSGERAVRRALGRP
jgi:transposase-like protein